MRFNAYATATPINYKVAAARGVRSILGVGVSRPELLRKFNAVSLGKALLEVGQPIL